MQRFALLLLLCLTSTAASAIPFTWVASGTISFVAGSHPELGPLPAAEDDPFAFQFTYDPAGLVDADPANTHGFYPDGLLAASLTIAGQTTHFDLSPGFHSHISVQALDSAGLTLYVTTTEDLAPDALQFALQLFSIDGVAPPSPFPSDAIPASPPDPTLFDLAAFSLLSFNRPLTGPEDAFDYHLEGQVTALTSIATPVPEPAVLALFALGLSGMFVARRRG